MSSAGVVLVICGPIASGKSTLARAVARLAGGRGLVSAAVDLDLVYEMLEHRGGAKDDAAIWSRARRITATLAAVLLADGVDVVVAEGDFHESADRVLFPDATFVTLTVPFETALARARSDPSRGLSQDADFLGRHYASIAPPSGTVIDTSEVGIDDAAAGMLGLALDR